MTNRLVTDRRQFLIGLFGTAAIATAGPLPKALEQLPEVDFKAAMNLAYLKAQSEIYMSVLGIYGFATIEYLDVSPWIRVVSPRGMKPMREESDRIGDEALKRLKGIKS